MSVAGTDRNVGRALGCEVDCEVGCEFGCEVGRGLDCKIGCEVGCETDCVIGCEIGHVWNARRYRPDRERSDGGHHYPGLRPSYQSEHLVHWTEHPPFGSDAWLADMAAGPWASAAGAAVFSYLALEGLQDPSEHRQKWEKERPSYYPVYWLCLLCWRLCHFRYFHYWQVCRSSPQTSVGRPPMDQKVCDSQVN